MVVPGARSGLVFVFVTMLLDIMGFAIVMPILPTYLQELTGADLSAAAVQGGWLLSIYALMQFLCAPLIGNLSDRFGRRPVLLASLTTFGLDNLICAVAPSYPWLFVGRLLAGISGASISTASAYIADVSTEANRARNFGLISVAFGTGFVLGPVIGGILGTYGPRVPFYGAALLALCNVLLCLSLLPESLSPEKRRKFELRRANPIGALREMREYPATLWVALVFFLFFIGHMAYPTIWSFAAKYRYGWSERQIGLSLGVYGLTSIAVTGLVLPRVVRRVGEWRTAVVGFLASTAGFGGYALASQGWMIYAVIVLACLEGMADPPLRSIAAGSVPVDQQGELQGALTSLASLANLLGPLVMTQIFSAFTSTASPVNFPGAPFALSAVFEATALAVLLLRLRPSVHR